MDEKKIGEAQFLWLCVRALIRDHFQQHDLLHEIMAQIESEDSKLAQKVIQLHASMRVTTSGIKSALAALKKAADQADALKSMDTKTSH